MTTYGATNDDEVIKLTTFCFQWWYIWFDGFNYCPLENVAVILSKFYFKFISRIACAYPVKLPLGERHKVAFVCNSPHKGPVTRKMFPFDDVIINLDKGTLNQYQNSVIYNVAVGVVYLRRNFVLGLK